MFGCRPPPRAGGPRAGRSGRDGASRGPLAGSSQAHRPRCREGDEAHPIAGRGGKSSNGGGLRPLTAGVRCYNRGLPSGSNSVGRVSASQAECRGFESRLPLHSLVSCYARPPDCLFDASIVLAELARRTKTRGEEPETSATPAHVTPCRSTLVSRRPLDFGELLVTLAPLHVSSGHGGNGRGR
jgi:hypothetical protein